MVGDVSDSLEVLVALAAALALAVPLLLRIERPRARVSATSLTLLLLSLAGWAALRHGPRPASVARAVPVVERRSGWAGSETCRSCHPGEHASWHASYHRSMTQEPSRDAVKAAFAGETLTAPDGRAWTLARDGEAFTASV